VSQVDVPPGALQRCLGPVAKPPSGLVGDALTAWQRDRNRLRECARRNDEKIQIIEELLHEPA